MVDGWAGGFDRLDDLLRSSHDHHRDTRDHRPVRRRTALAAFRAGAGPTIILIDPALSTHTGSAKLARRLPTILRRQLRPPRTRRQRGRASRIGRSGAGGRGHRRADRRGGRPRRPLRDVLGRGARPRSRRAPRRARHRTRRLRAAVHLRRSRPPVAPDLPARIAASVAAGDRSAAVKAFFVEAIGVPRFAVAVMRMLPLVAACEGPRPHPALRLRRARRHAAGRAAAGRSGGPGSTAPTIVMVGLEERGVLPPHRKALADALPTVSTSPSRAAHHGSPQMSPGAIAPSDHRAVRRRLTTRHRPFRYLGIECHGLRYSVPLV